MKPHALLAAAALCLLARPALADHSVIKHPGDHPKYVVEAEPHVLLGLWGVPGPGNGTGVGLGFRASIPIVENGFIPKINNSVAITFGIDWAHYEVDNWCGRYWNNGNGNQVYCGYDDDFDILWLPIAMQWNFFLSENWSVFGEPGLGLRINDDHYNDNVDLDLVLYVGGRFHFNDSVSLTMRLGWPGALSVGASFFL